MDKTWDEHGMQLSTHVGSLHRRIDDLRDVVTQQSASFDRRFDSIDRRLNTHLMLGGGLVVALLAVAGGLIASLLTA